MSHLYTIKEYDSFTRNITVQSENYHSLPEHIFDQLEQFVLSSKKDTEQDTLEFMTITSRRGLGKLISVKNYVGLITMKDGTEIQILPKLYSKDKESSEAETKKIFLDMIKFLKEIPYKKFNLSNLHIEKNTIFEIFIRMFIEEAFKLVKRGLRSSYIEHQDNEYFYKGKLNFSQHIKSNYVRKDRFYIEYDVFNINRPENKLIKTTLEFLRKTSSSRKNKKDIITLLTAFDLVDDSLDPKLDFTKINLDRNMNDYSTILNWCRIFLGNKSFSTFKGNGVAFALLFPMEKVFESYVAGKLNQYLNQATYEIKTQHRHHHLFDEPKRFLLKPDIVIQSRTCSIVMDTKWKLLALNQSNYGVSQVDMYQAYAYSRKYGSKLVYLLYPWTNEFNHINHPISFQSYDGATVRIGFVDLLNIDNCISNLSLEIDEVMK